MRANVRRNAEEANYDYTGYDVDSPMSIVKRSGGHLPIRRTVYNIEVANTHTYFVGELGLWVHNKNPSSVPQLPSVAQLPTQSMRAALARVGVTTSVGKDYSKQFGVTMTLHKLVEIEGSRSTQLLAFRGDAMIEAPEGPDLTAAQQAQLWALAEPLLEQLKQSPEENSVMWITDFRPSAAVLVSAALSVATASPALAADKALGVCQIARPVDGTEIGPISAAGAYLFDYHGNDARYKAKLANSDFFSGAKIKLLKAPAHGEVTLDAGEDAAVSGNYHYIPKAGYVGQDRFTMKVEKDGVKVRIEYLMEVVPYDEHTTYMSEDGERHSLFCKPDTWKISQYDFDSGSQDYVAWQRAGQLSTLLAAPGHLLTGFTDLAGTALGQTIGEGPSAQVIFQEGLQESNLCSLLTMRKSYRR